MNTEKTAQHTPGPWLIVEPTPLEQVVQSAIGRSNGCYVTAMCPGPDGEANARLIAAAPELLEALKIAYVQMECYNVAAHNAGTCPCKRAKAAIDKAEGR